MGSLISPELTLDCSLGLPKTTNEFLTEASRIQNVSEKISKLDDYVNRLEDELKKIEAFKRELPLCMVLLNDAIGKLKEELTEMKKSNVKPVFEEFMPLKKNKDDDEKLEKENDIINSREKMNWMSSVQLWNSDNQNQDQDQNQNQNPNTDNLERRNEEIVSRQSMNDLFTAAALVKSGGGDESPGVPSLSLRIPEVKDLKEEIYSSGLSSKSSSSRSGSPSGTNVQSNFKVVQQQTARKQRRCWSPELHRRFVNALQHLGGPQAATPKQIRELMQVDGLTNDEVKSHLQKYRLHTRRVPPTTNTGANQPAVLWTSQEHESSKQGHSQSGSPQGHLPGSSRATSMTGGDSVDEEDDEKSESHSWKSHHNHV